MMKTIGEVQKRLPENILTKCGVLIYIYISSCAGLGLFLRRRNVPFHLAGVLGGR